ncbi:hypothetical protein QE401_000353 [Pseudoroseomonas cervicalis]|nr:hypothetical protein [Pseudoroseomonas cervicalis]
MIQGMQMDCPPGWQDRSMLILSAAQPGGSGVTPNMVVTQDRLPPDLPEAPEERMAALLDRQVAQMRGQLANFAEISRRILAGSRRPTAELRVDWSSPQALLTQWVTFVDAGEGRLLVATGTAGRADFAAAEPVFREMLRSFRLG